MIGFRTYDNWKTRSPDDEIVPHMSFQTWKPSCPDDEIVEELPPEDEEPEQPPLRTDLHEAWALIKERVAAFVWEEAAFSKYRDDVVIDGIMTAGEMRKLSEVLG